MSRIWLPALMTFALSFFDAAPGLALDQRMVGSWETQFSPSDTQPATWTILADGKFTLIYGGQSELPAEVGTVTAANGRWSKETSSHNIDGGGYQFLGPDR